MYYYISDLKKIPDCLNHYSLGDVFYIDSLNNLCMIKDKNIYNVKNYSKFSKIVDKQLLDFNIRAHSFMCDKSKNCLATLHNLDINNALDNDIIILSDCEDDFGKKLKAYEIIKDYLRIHEIDGYLWTYIKNFNIGDEIKRLNLVIDKSEVNLDMFLNTYSQIKLFKVLI